MHFKTSQACKVFAVHHSKGAAFFQGKEENDFQLSLRYTVTDDVGSLRQVERTYKVNILQMGFVALTLQPIGLTLVDPEMTKLVSFQIFILCISQKY